MHKLLLVPILMLLVGCNCVYQIKVNKDGSAQVDHKIRLIFKDEILKKDPTLIAEADIIGDDLGEKVTASESMMDPYLDSEIIREFEWKANKKYFFNGSYDISTIDSLGSYLDVFYRYVNPVFKLEKDKFIMTCPPGVDSLVGNDKTFGAIFIEMNTVSAKSLWLFLQ